MRVRVRINGSPAKAVHRGIMFFNGMFVITFWGMLFVKDMRAGMDFAGANMFAAIICVLAGIMASIGFVMLIKKKKAGGWMCPLAWLLFAVAGGVLIDAGIAALIIGGLPALYGFAVYRKIGSEVFTDWKKE